MNFDIWFNEQSKMVKVLFLLIPIIGWIIEILVRISALTKVKNAINIVGLVVFIIIGWAWVLTIVDAIYLLISEKLLFITEEEEY